MDERGGDIGVAGLGGVSRRVAEEPVALGVKFQHTLRSQRLLGNHKPFSNRTASPPAGEMPGPGGIALTGTGNTGWSIRVSSTVPRRSTATQQVLADRLTPRGDLQGMLKMRGGDQVRRARRRGSNATAFDPMLAREARENQKSFCPVGIRFRFFRGKARHSELKLEHHPVG